MKLKGVLREMSIKKKDTLTLGQRSFNASRNDSTAVVANRYTRLALAIAAGLLSACANTGKDAPKPYMASDWIGDGIFTQGVEGPAVDSNGNLYAVNYQREGTVGKVSGRHQAELFLDLPEGSTGNGIVFDTNGTMYIADYTGHNILRIAPGTKAVEVHAHNPAMNQPNDIAITRDGVIYASDPNWRNNTGKLWRVDTSGATFLLEDSMGTTNGVEVSPDDSRLYVNESIQRNVWVYDINQDGSLSNKRLLIHFDEHGLDGMRTDTAGNLYIARYGAGSVAVVSPQGELIREVQLKGQFPTNVAFGGPNGKQVFVTLQKRGAIETFFSEFPGRAPLKD